MADHIEADDVLNTLSVIPNIVINLEWINVLHPNSFKNSNVPFYKLIILLNNLG